MAKTIIGPTIQQFPSRATPAIVELKRTWADDWTIVPELEFMGGNLATTAHDLSSCVLLHRYGILKHPWESTDGRKSPTSLAGCWVRVRFAGPQGTQDAWVGKIDGEGRDIFGSVETRHGLIPAGVQHFEAFGPLQILRKIHVGRSFWCINGESALLNWVPTLNERNGRTDKPSATAGQSLGSGPSAESSGSRSGNRYAEPIPISGDQGEVYVHGGTDLWNYHQYADYIIKLFVDEKYRGDGPHWTLGGQCEVLKNLTDPIEFGSTQTVDQILQALIRPDFGLDYKIVPTEEGFEVSVFVLTRQSCGWGGKTLPGNPDSVKIHASRGTDSISTRVAKTSSQRYGTIRILGRRIVVCASLSTVGRSAASMVKKWNTQDESDYKHLPDLASTSPEVCDEARRQEKYRDVYRKFGASNHWFHDDSIWRSPWWNGKGVPFEDNGAMQRHDRSTLPWLPLDAGVDYSQKPYVDNDAVGIIPSLRKPLVWLYSSESGGRWIPVDQLGIGLSVSHDDIGVFLHASPNHLLAAGVYGPFYGAKPTNIEPMYDYRQMIATVAYRTDQRIYCEQRIEGSQPSDGVLEIEAPDCQFWWLAPNTMLDVDSSGQPITSPVTGDNPTDGIILRNDWARMAAKMAGVLARHYRERARAQIVVHGCLPWSGLLGQILTVIDEGGSTQTIESPITEIRWIGGEKPMTIISSGFASEG